MTVARCSAGCGRRGAGGRAASMNTVSPSPMRAAARWQMAILAAVTLLVAEGVLAILLPLTESAGRAAGARRDRRSGRRG